MFQQCQLFFEISKGNHRFESNLDNICNDLMECGCKICIVSSHFSQTYIGEPLHEETKVHRSSNLFEVILFLGKHNTEDVGSFSFIQKHYIQGPKIKNGGK